MASKYSITALLGVDSSGVGKGLKKGEKEVKGFASKLKTTAKVGAAAFAAAGGAALAFGAKSLKTFGSFEKGMNNVFTLLPGISKDAMDQMTKQTLDVSTKMGVLPEKIVPALYDALSAGVPKDNVFAFLESTSKAAIGGSVDLGTAVNAVTGVMNAYAATAPIKAAKASDIMFTAIRLGKTTFEELSASLGDVTPIAAAMGVSFEQVAAALATSTAITGNTAKSTTGLKNLIAELGKEGAVANKNFAKIAGKTFPQFIKSGGTLVGALELMKKHTDAQGGSVADLFGSLDAGQSALQLAGKKTFVKALEDMQGAGGATGKAFDQMDQGINRTFERISAQFEKFKVLIGKALAPILQALEPMFAALTKAMENFPFEELSAAIDEFVKELTPILKELFGGDNMKQGSNFIIEFIKTLLSLILNIVKIVKSLAPILRPVLTILGAALKILQFAFESVGLLFDLITGNFDAIGKRGPKLAKLIEGIFTALGEAILGIFKTVLWAPVTLVAIMLKGIWELFKLIPKALIAGFKWIVKTATDGWAKIWDGLKMLWELVMSPFAGVKKAIEGAIKWLFGALDGVWKWLEGTFLGKIFTEIKNFVVFFKDVLGGAIKWVVGLVDGAINGLLNMVGLGSDAVKELSKEEAKARAVRNRARAAESKDAAHQEYLRKKREYLKQADAKIAAEKKRKSDQDEVAVAAKLAKWNNMGFADLAMGARTFGVFGKTLGTTKMSVGQLKAAMMGEADAASNKWWKGLDVRQQRLLIGKMTQHERQFGVISEKWEAGVAVGSKEWMKMAQAGQQQLAAAGITGPMAQHIMRKKGLKSFEELYMLIAQGTKPDELIKEVFGEDFFKQFQSQVKANVKAGQQKMLERFGVKKSKQQDAFEQDMFNQNRKMLMQQMGGAGPQNMTPADQVRAKFAMGWKLQGGRWVPPVNMQGGQMGAMNFMGGQMGMGGGMMQGVDLGGRALNELACACKHLKNIDGTTRSIDHTLKGKFVNQ